MPIGKALAEGSPATPAGAPSTRPRSAERGGSRAFGYAPGYLKSRALYVPAWSESQNPLWGNRPVTSDSTSFR